MTIVFHGHKCSCFFQPDGESERISWEYPQEGDYEPDYDLCSYEETLFSIWDYDTGYSLERDEGSKAVWCIDDFGDVNRLEDFAKRIDKILLPIRLVKGYSLTTGSILNALRDGKTKWMPGRVDWSYIKYLDKAIKTCEDMVTVNKISQTGDSADDLAGKKPAETEQNAKRIIAAILISLILILLFELFVYFGPVTWFRNHPHTYGIQGSISGLIPCLIFGFLKPRWRKWCWETAAIVFLVGLLSLL